MLDETDVVGRFIHMVPYSYPMRTIILLLALAAVASASPAAAQLLRSPPRVGSLMDAVDPLLDRVGGLPVRAARQLADARLDRFEALVRAHPREITLDPDGNPARAGEVMVEDPNDALIVAAGAKGFRLIERDQALGIGFARLEVPAGMSLKRAIQTLRKLGAGKVNADQLHFQSGVMTAVTGNATPLLAPASGPTVGMIDGGATGGFTQRGFAAGAPRASDHGSAIASLIAGMGPVRGAAPGARAIVADVYGSDPAGGSVSAIVKALDWLVSQQVPVVSVSLVGPQNSLLARVIAAAQARGTIIVAAVGNDGPASPLTYPASYPGVIAVTAVDGRNRILIEAGRAAHLDYAAPGADILAANARGGAVPVRGTSFATPLVAARIAAAYPQPALARKAAALGKVDGEAQKLGPRFGRGLVCGGCRTPAR